MDSESSFLVELPAFRGPLELLLVLVKKNELAIGEVSVEEIAEQFSDYLRTRGRDLEAVSDFVLQAATLLEMKSRSLLGQPPMEQEERAEAQPAAWVRHVLQYQHYWELASRLEAREECQNRMRTRPEFQEALEPSESCEVRVNPTELIAAFDRVLRAAPRTTEIPSLPALSLGQIRQRILSLVSDSPRIPFDSLFEPWITALDRVAFFLCVLEMVKDGELRLEQTAPLEALWVVRSDGMVSVPEPAEWS